MATLSPEAERALSPEAERAWGSLRRHLERSQRFTLVFLFSESPAAFAEVQRRLAARKKGSLEVLRLEREAPWREGLSLLLEQAAAKIEAKQPLWLALEAGPTALEMDARRGELLGALNQYRSRLEREFQRPLLVALPTSYLGQVWHVAPDLWTVRGAVVELPGRTRVVERSLEAPMARLSAAEPPGLEAIAEWQRLADTARTEPEKVSPFVAQAAAEAALARGMHKQAQEIAEAGLALARAQRERGSAQDRRRNVMVAVSVLGEVLLARLRLGEASAVFEEALALSRGLAEESNGAAEALRDVSVSLNNVGRVREARQDLDGALAVYEESLQLRRRLVSEVGETAQGLRDVSVSLDNVGRMREARQDLGGALGAYEESLQLRRRLVAEVGETAQGLRDVSMSLDNVGRVREAQQDQGGAQAAYEESLQLARRLVSEVGETAQGLRDVSVSLNNVGRVRAAQQDLGGAQAAYEESLGLRRRLVTEHGETAQWLVDLVGSLYFTGWIAVAQQRLPDAVSAYREALVLCRRLGTLAAESSRSRRMLQGVLPRVRALAEVAQRRGNTELAASLEDELAALPEQRN